ncbi:hypothetical protein H6501_05005 [Candidatus Woesearchaeota archaeon]|nr:hypothetical protein [Nanoarchaeota archaeon]MCB9370932.1 hypothetical protein [Candidatus Woesearchaeota archaeon]USN44033.1 MAG: hypothetical protein H6500_06610 [Candidatus Woesearchaeota archaeon]
MYIFLEDNEFYKQTKEAAKKRKLKTITLFTIELGNKQKNKAEIEKFRKRKSELKPEKTAIKVILSSIDNSTTGTVNSLKQECDILIGQGGLNKVNRYFIEQTQIDILKDPHTTKYLPKTDFVHHFNSGLNHVLCQFAKEKDQAILSSLGSLQKSKSYFAAKDMGRINQNLKLTKKYKLVHIITLIAKQASDIKNSVQYEALISLFDATTEQKKQSATAIETLLKTKEEEKSPNYITKQIRRIK